jgi:hypothetical protein
LIIPFAPTPSQEDDRNWGMARALVRLPSTLPPAVAKARLDVLVPGQGFPLAALGADATVDVRTLDLAMRRLGGTEFKLTFALMATIVLLACVNVAGLGMARRRQRAREYATRRALGAAGWQITRLALCEVTVLAAAGTATGLWLTAMSIGTAVRLIPSYIVTIKTPSVDWRGSTSLVAMLVAIVSSGTDGCPQARLSVVRRGRPRLRHPRSPRRIDPGGFAVGLPA